MLFTILISSWFGANSTCQMFTIYFQEPNVAILLSSEVEEQTQVLQSRHKIWLSVHTVQNIHILNTHIFQHLQQRKFYREEKLLVCAAEKFFSS